MADSTDTRKYFDTVDAHPVSHIGDCRILTLSRNYDPRGSLTAVQNGDNLPFAIKRVFFIYDVPGGTERGGHSHRTLHELLVAVSGSFSVTITDGVETRRVLLNRPYQGLYIPPGMWTLMDDFSSGSICLVLASHPYEEEDYVRDYQEFLQLTHSKRPL